MRRSAVIAVVAASQLLTHPVAADDCATTFNAVRLECVSVSGGQCPTAAGVAVEFNGAVLTVRDASGQLLYLQPFQGE